MLITALLRCLDIPGDPTDRFADLPSGAVVYPNEIRGQFCKFPVFQINHISGIGHHGGNIGGKVILPDSHSQDQGACFPHHKNPLRFIGAHNAHCIRSPKSVGSLHHRLFKITGVIHFHQVDNHFRIRFTFEAIALPGQLLTQFHIILDDSIMHHRKPAVIAGMRVGIGFGGCPMGGPAGVSDACGTGSQAAVLCLFAQICDPSCHLADVNGVVFRNRNARGVIAPVFQFFQSFQQQRSRALVSCIAHNSAHRLPPSSGLSHWKRKQCQKI